jgi:hypothetical protein
LSIKHHLAGVVSIADDDSWFSLMASIELLFNDLIGNVYFKVFIFFHLPIFVTILNKDFFTYFHWSKPFMSLNVISFACNALQNMSGSSEEASNDTFADVSLGAKEHAVTIMGESVTIVIIMSP